MDNNQLLKIINSIREKSEREKLVVFVGSGVSRNVAGFPSWYELVDNMASAVGYSKCTSCKSKKTDCEKTCLLKKEYSTDEFLKIPQYLYNSDETLYLDTLKDSIVDINVDAPLSSAIFDVNPDHIITTNYDRLLEYSNNEYRNQYDVIIDDKALLSSEKSKFIIKMHGDIQNLNTIVLKEQDYLDYSQKHVLIEMFVKSLLTDHTVLFLGYSLNDYNIKLIISWLNYMRSQNDALGEGQKVGYIIMDEDSIPSDEISYFSNNNIEVVNIHNMPLVTTIPSELSQDKGKRLYSFLKSIAEPSIAANTFYYDYLEDTIKFLSSHIFVNYKTILGLIYIKSYDKKGTNIRLIKDTDYNNLSMFFKSENEAAKKLKILFVNAGITSFSFNDFPKIKTIELGNITDHALLSDDLFQLYISNDYAKLLEIIENEKNILKKSFYDCIVNGYKRIYKYYKFIDFNKLSGDEKVSYLHNLSIIETINDLSIPFNSKGVKKYIENISDFREKELYDDYLNMYSGNSDALYDMNIYYDKVKESIHQKKKKVFGGVPWSSVLDIQNYAYSYLEFYFYNYILFYGFSDLKKYLKPYISAIICANSEQENKTQDIGFFSSNNEKFFINKLDFNIITKFISTKELYNLLSEYKIIQLNTSIENISFLANCFYNLCNSIVTKHTHGFWSSSFDTFSNLILIFNRIVLDDESKEIISNAVKVLITDESFYKQFFSIHYADIRICINEFSNLFNKIQVNFDFDVLKEVLKNEEFFTFSVNVNFYNLRRILKMFIDEGTNVQNDLKEIIDNESDFNKKIILLRLFYDCFQEDSIIEKYKEFLTSNFLKLDRNAKYDFVFNKWVTPSQEDLQTFIENIIKIAESQKPGVRSFPDPVDSNLEVVYIFYMDDIINDISSLEPLSEGRPILQFLLYPHNFDYSQVDFSYYMWENFARRPKFMKLFIEHKQDIIPKMKKRVDMDEATDFEKRVLYRFFLSEDELMNGK